MKKDPERKSDSKRDVFTSNGTGRRYLYTCPRRTDVRRKSERVPCAGINIEITLYTNTSFPLVQVSRLFVNIT